MNFDHFFWLPAGWVHGHDLYQYGWWSKENGSRGVLNYTSAIRLLAYGFRSPCVRARRRLKIDVELTKI